MPSEDLDKIARVLAPIIIGLCLPISLSIEYNGVIDWCKRAISRYTFAAFILCAAEFTTGNVKLNSAFTIILCAIYLTQNINQAIQRGQYPDQSLRFSRQLESDSYMRAMQDAHNTGNQIQFQDDNNELDDLFWRDVHNSAVQDAEAADFEAASRYSLVCNPDNSMWLALNLKST